MRMKDLAKDMAEQLHSRASDSALLHDVDALAELLLNRILEAARNGPRPPIVVNGRDILVLYSGNWPQPEDDET